MDLVFVRHAETLGNAQGRWQGRQDSDRIWSISVGNPTLFEFTLDVDLRDGSRVPSGRATNQMRRQREETRCNL